MGQIEIVFAGQGGQGVRLVSIILGQACARQGKQVASSASYGPEVRGTFTRSEVIIADEFIVYPRVLCPTLLVALSQEGYDRVAGEVPATGLILYEDEAVTPAADLPCRGYAIPAAKLAAQAGYRGAANMVMLGALAALTGLADLHALAAVLPPGRRDANTLALEKGYQRGLSIDRPAGA